MRVTVRAFAGAREILGASRTIEVPDGATVAGLWGRLCADFPALSDFPLRGLAVNREYVDPDTVVTDGDEVAVIPPVSGG